MKCPNCNTSLVMSDRQGIEIDYCPDCRGVWLDRGELDKIIERSNQEIESVKKKKIVMMTTTTMTILLPSASRARVSQRRKRKCQACSAISSSFKYLFENDSLQVA